MGALGSCAPVSSRLLELRPCVFTDLRACGVGASAVPRARRLERKGTLGSRGPWGQTEFCSPEGNSGVRASFRVVDDHDGAAHGRCRGDGKGKSGVLQPIMPLDLPVKVRPWELTVYP